MDAPQFPDDFSEFLKLLDAHRVEYLLVGGYAVGLHGYPRATIDLDMTIGCTCHRCAFTRRWTTSCSPRIIASMPAPIPAPMAPYAAAASTSQYLVPGTREINMDRL